MSTAVMVTIAIQVATFLLMFGGLRQLVKSNERWLSDIAEEIKGHSDQLADHKSRIGTMERLCEERHAKRVQA